MKAAFILTLDVDDTDLNAIAQEVQAVLDQHLNDEVLEVKPYAHPTLAPATIPPLSIQPPL